MKQETGKKKSKLWLWLVIGAVALLAVAGVVLALVLGGGGETGPKGGRSEIYWNVDRRAYTENSESGLSTREAGEDGSFRVRFAINGELVEYEVADKQLINYIDTMDAMGLVKDSDGVVVDVIDPKDIAKEVNKNAYVKSATASKIVANTSVAMNGMNINIKLEEGVTEIYDVTPQAEVPGQKITTAELKAMDTLVVYANDLDQVTHVFVNSHSKESKVYWRADQFYNSTEKATSRVPDENGAYTIPFFCEGEVVELKCKDKAIVTKIDSISRWKCHFGLTFDEEGYIIEQFASAIGIQGIVVTDCWDVVEIDGETVTIQRLVTNDGSVWTGTIPAGTPIYEAGIKAKREREGGRKIDSLQLGDRVTTWTDTNGQVVLVYVAERLVDSPAYWIPTRKYNSTTKETTREIGTSGYYEIELVKEGANKKEIYYVKDKETMSYIDSITSKVVGLKVLPGNIVEFAYDSEAVTGYTVATRGGVVTAVTGGIFTKMTYGKRGTESNLVLAPNARVYNVSGYGEYGAVTTIQPGDHVYGCKQPTGEILLAYVTKRTIGGEKMYWNLEIMWDKTKQTSTRPHDEEGWYHFTMAYQGKQVELKTKVKEIVDKIDMLSIGAVALDVSGGVIYNVYDAGYPYGGNKVASGYKFQYVTDEGKYFCTYASDKQKTAEFVMAEDCVIYNVSPIFDKFQGEQIYSIPKDAMLTVFCDIYGEAKVVYVRSKTVNDMYWKTEILYDSTNKVTKREADADGYYWYDLAVNGECKRFKTKDKKIANSMDSYAGAFGLNVRGDEIFGFVATNSVKGVSGNGHTTASVLAIDGRTITVEVAGETETMKLSSDCKIYDVSPLAKSFGEVSTLKVGDVVRTYLNTDKSGHCYVYIKARASRVKGEVGYCEACKKEVKWTPMDGTTAISTSGGHWYVPANLTAGVQSSFVSKTKDVVVCLDLNGKVLTRAAGGRMFRVDEGEVLNIMDSVGNGKIVSYSGEGYNGGLLLMGGGAVVNMYGGTLEHVQGDYKAALGGNVYLAGADTTFNLYNGVVTGGASYAAGKNSGCGGNFYVSGGATLNVYNGEISNGKAYGRLSEGVDSATGKPKYTAINSYGGNIYMTESSNVNILGGVVKDGEAVREIFIGPDGVKYPNMSYGGNIHKVSTQKLSGTLTIENATVSGGHAHRGGNLCAYATAGGTAKVEDPNYDPEGPDQGGYVVLNNATITGGTVSQFGGNIMSNCSNWTIVDSKIVDGESQQSGGNIYSQGGIYYLYGTSIANGKAVTGGNVNLYRNKYDSNVFYIGEGTVIENGVATSTGGNINVQSKNYVLLNGTAVDPDKDPEKVGTPLLPILVLAGGEIKNGQAKTADNIYSAGHMSLLGGSISGGNVVFSGANEAILNIEGAEVNDTFDVKTPLGIVISGAPKIANLALDGSVKATVNDMQEGASVKVSSSCGTILITESIENVDQYLSAGYITEFDSEQELEITKNKELLLKAPEIYELANAMDFTGADSDGKVTAQCPVCREGVEWSVLPANATGNTYTIEKGGHYYLSESVDYTKNNGRYDFTAKETLCLHLNGQKLTSSVRAFYTEKAGTVLNVMGDGTVTGKGTMVSDDTYGQKGNGAFDLTTEANFYGGTYISTGTGPVISNRKTSSGSALVSIYAGTTITNNAGGYAMHVVGNGSLAINGGTINGTVAEVESAGISISRAPVVNHIEVAEGKLLNIGILQPGANITVVANGVFTRDLADAAALKNYFSATNYGKVAVDGAALAVVPGTRPEEVYEAAKAMDFSDADSEGKVIAECPVCNAEKEWMPLPANTTGATMHIESGHYYLSEDVDYTNNNFLYSFGGTQNKVKYTSQACVNLNGQNITNIKAKGRVFYTEQAGSVLNLMGDGVVTGEGYMSSDATYGQKGFGVVDLTTEANFFGGTYVSTGAGPAIGNRKTTTGLATVSIYEGTTVVNETANGMSLYVLTNAAANIHGGTFTGRVVDSGSKGITLSGAPKISALELAGGAKITVGELVDGAQITVIANGIFTKEFDNAQAYMDAGYFISGVSVGELKVVGKALSVETEPIYELAKKMDFSAGGTVNAKCPVCNVEVDWKPLPVADADHVADPAAAVDNKRYNLPKDAHYHFYLDANTDYTQNVGFYNISGTTQICLNLNGQTMEHLRRAFYTEGTSVLNIMGEGTVRGAGTNASNRGVLDMTRGLNLYGGTYESTSDASPVIVARGSSTLNVVNIYEGTTIRSTGSAAALFATASATVNIYGGTVDGKVYTDKTTNVFFVSGNAVIDYLELPTGAKLGLGELLADAEITVSADGIFTNAVANADAYVAAGNIKAAEGKEITVTAGVMSMAAATP